MWGCWAGQSSALTLPLCPPRCGGVGGGHPMSWGKGWMGIGGGKGRPFFVVGKGLKGKG